MQIQTEPIQTCLPGNQRKGGVGFVLGEKPEGTSWIKGPVYFPIILNFTQGYGPPSGLTAEQLAAHQAVIDAFDSKPF